MPRIAFIGAGSTVFTRNIVGDLLAIPELADRTTIALMDIDEGRLGTSEVATRRLIEGSGTGARVEATLERRAALEGADFVVSSFQVGGYRPSTVVDFEVPKRYGLRQTIADTLGVGGIMRGLRTIPVLLDVCRDMEEECPEALLLQYVNPMAMLCWAVAEASASAPSGCATRSSTPLPSWPATSAIPVSEIDYLAAGINHLAFYLRFERDGESLYPALQQLIEDGTGARRQPGALRGAEALRGLRHRVVRALRRVRPVVHQGRAGRPDRALQRPARRVPAALRAPDRRVGGDAGEPRGRRRAVVRAERRVRRRHRARVRDRRAVHLQRERAQQLERPAADRQPAARLLRRGAVHRRRAGDRAAGRRSASPASSRR